MCTPLLRGTRVECPLFGSPRAFREVRVVAPASNHMPMQMRDEVAELCVVDLVRREKFTHRFFERFEKPPQIEALGLTEFGHFGNMLHTHDPDEAREFVRRCVDRVKKTIFPDGFFK